MTDESKNSTKRSASRVLMMLATCFSFASLLVAGTANAGVDPAFVYPFTVSGTIYEQGVSDKTGDDILEKGKFNQKDLTANCTFMEKPEKGVSLYAVLEEPCGGDINVNDIFVGRGSNSGGFVALERIDAAAPASVRAEGDPTGRQISLIGLRPESSRR